MRPAVIVPVHADPEGLRVTLARLTDVPVVVAVDGAHADTEEVARAAGATVVVLTANQGSYAARNAALDALPADVDAVLFTDAGCLPAPGWVSAHLAALAEADLSGGAVVVTHGQRPTPAEWVDRSRNLRQQAYVEEGFAATCNLAVRREVLTRHRFDARLRSGGDREFCMRATSDGSTLVFTPGAVVEHPARRTGEEVLAKARRVGAGVAAQPPGLRRMPPRPARPNRVLGRQARAQGLPAGTLWCLRVGLLDRRRSLALRAAASRPPHVEGLHVVVLLASRWSSLEQMNTRWRQVVQAWVHHPDVARLTLVDHPWFRPTARELVRPTASWLPGVELLDLTVPTTVRPRPLDRLAWWRSARALRRLLPTADEELVVSTSSVSTPLLQHLGGPHTTLAFDAVDVWRNLAVHGDLGARLGRGYLALQHADTLTAVSQPIADSLTRWTSTPATVIPNGVELAAYQVRRPAPAGLPQRPFAVYVGSLSSRLDVELVADVAARVADEVEVVLAGPADEATAARLSEAPLTWLGPVPTDLVPGLLQRAAVGLFPHRHTEMTEAWDSMKLLEYAAAGLPVVSTELPGLPPGAVGATGAEAFAAAILRHARAPRPSETHAWVGDRDWSVVADRVLQTLRARRQVSAKAAR